jgi:acetolactate synthase-1/2/3 large subunit
MNGAESLVHTLVRCGVDTCFANPGTSEMHFVSALDRIPGIRSILCLFEGAVTGAADGYGRMAERPAATLLHLGPGLAYGGPNLHNARRAHSPIVNVVGDHATYHRAYDAPLTSDVGAIAGAFSDWMRLTSSAATVARDAAEAVHAASGPPGRVSTLILPANAAWDPAEDIHAPLAKDVSLPVDDARIAEAAKLLRANKAVIILGNDALRPELRALARGVADAVGAHLLAPVGNRRIDKGRGTVPIERIPFSLDLAVGCLAHYDTAIMIGCKAPVAFFAYPGKPSELLPSHCKSLVLANPEDDASDALQRLAGRLGATPAPPPSATPAVLPENGRLSPARIGEVIAALLPENAIVCDESVTVGRGFFSTSDAAAAHSWLQITGGAIGTGVPMATGAAIACPDRQVIALVGDGSALYTIQALWTQARENLDVVTLVLSNRAYAILKGELRNVGAQMGKAAKRMLTLDDPALSWVEMARAFGVPGTQASTVEELASQLSAAIARPGPGLVEVVVDTA